MVNSCTGRMGNAAAEALVRAGLTLVPFTFTGYSAGVAVCNIGVAGVPVEVVGRARRQEVMEQVKEEYPGLVVVDYTLPSCVNENAEFYARNGVPFVIGTSGGKRERLVEVAESAGLYAVIASQMGKQVVAFQSALELLGQRFPGCFSGYDVEVVESHQSSKVDVSGTARAVVGALQELGVDCDERVIKRIRSRSRSVEEMGVPEEALGGHAFHTYRLTSPDGSVAFVFKHNVVGRSIYAEGTVDAVLFLAKMREEGAKKKVYNMQDVLKGGSLR